MKKIKKANLLLNKKCVSKLSQNTIVGGATRPCVSNNCQITDGPCKSVECAKPTATCNCPTGVEC